jgi:hypothetical protein
MKILLLILLLAGPTFAGYDDLDPHSQELIQQFAQDPEVDVIEGEQGEVIVKKKTKKSTNPDDEKDLDKINNQQASFYYGLVGGTAQFTNRKLYEKYFDPSNVNQSQPIQTEWTAVELGARLPYNSLKRLFFSGTVAINMDLTNPPKEDGTHYFTNSGRGNVNLRLLAAFDALIFSKGRRVIAVGAFVQTGRVVERVIDQEKQRTRQESTINHDFTGKGIEVRYTDFMGEAYDCRCGTINWYLVGRVDQYRTVVLGAGIGFTFGKRLPVKTRLEK